ncbi:glycosyltransferase [Aquincola sp. MAHUQ-54]|uniref:Glycosyltransferase n=1 Tax=Aquincola agrisoli TaxID=3119538 RepID=A0AAW9QEX8_9BURK
MIVVVAPNPSTENQKDGMIQRVAHIDALMASSPRVYLDLSFRRFVRKELLVEGCVTIYRLNLFAHIFLIARLLKQADLVYIHSAYNALKAMAFPTRAHVVFDAHGIVPEELAQEGHTRAARVFAFAERRVLRRCNTLVCVTRSMLAHFKAKHGDRPGRDEIVLPILPRLGQDDDAARALQATRDSHAVIYAGGMQAWQNVDKMLDAAQARSDLKYTFLTGDLQRFEARLSRIGLKDVTCRSVAPESVKDFYLKHEYGFILRDEVLVNLVACPTKLVEYLYWGVLPVVITPRIGDFTAETLRSITLEQFKRGEFPDAATRAAMRAHNQRTVTSIAASARTNQDRLQRRLVHAA